MSSGGLLNGKEKDLSFRIVGIGEVLWDLLPGARKLGGAPANFVYHAAALGAEAHLISRVGRDEAGRELLDRLEDLDLPINTIEIDSVAPTGTVSVSIESDGQPCFAIHEGVAWDNLIGEAPGRVVVSRADAVSFGTLAQRSEPARAAIQSLVGATPATALRVFDINLRQQYYTRSVIEQSLTLANVLKVNETELPCLAEIFDLSGDAQAQIARLAERHALDMVAYTRGGRGSVLFRDGRWSEHLGLTAKVVDTVGAGDAFTAAMTLGLLAGWDLDQINDNANRLAAYVAGCAGATPELPPELRSPFLTSRGGGL